MTRIVVGIDGSTESRQALAWAFEEARLRGGEVLVVHAYTPPVPLTTTTIGHPLLSQRMTDDIMTRARQFEAEEREQARQRAEWIVEGIVGEVVGDTGVPWRTVVIPGSRPAHALVDVARTADLLVVGSRGLGAVAGRMLGSVSQHCTRHATCPVVVIGQHAPVQAATPAAV